MLEYDVIVGLVYRGIEDLEEWKGIEDQLLAEKAGLA